MNNVEFMRYLHDMPIEMALLTLMVIEKPELIQATLPLMCVEFPEEAPKFKALFSQISGVQSQDDPFTKKRISEILRRRLGLREPRNETFIKAAHERTKHSIH